MIKVRNVKETVYLCDVCGEECSSGENLCYHHKDIKKLVSELVKDEFEKVEDLFVSILNKAREQKESELLEFVMAEMKKHYDGKSKKKD